MKPAPRHILMTADTVGGVWSYAIELVRAMEPIGVAVTLAAMGEAPSEQQCSDAKQLSNLELRARPYALEWMDDPWEEVDASKEWLMQLQQEVRPEMVHLNTYAHAALPWHAPVLLVAHSCVYSWYAAVRDEAPPQRFEEYHERVVEAIRSADAVAAPTRAMLDALERHYGPVPNGHVICNARRPRDFPPGEKEPFVLTAGRLWDEAKNVAALEGVAAQIDWPVRVAGEERHPDGGEARFEGLEMLGHLSREAMADRMARASIFALPARYEPFGLAALEAALAGCALVLGEIDSLREVWGTAASFVTPDDDAALQQEIQRLIDDPQLLAERQRAARSRALDYDPERMARGYLDLYARMTGRSLTAYYSTT